MKCHLSTPLSICTFWHTDNSAAPELILTRMKTVAFRSTDFIKPGATRPNLKLGKLVRTCVFVCVCFCVCPPPDTSSV